MNLFDNKTRTKTEPAEFNENMYDYYDNNAQPQRVIIRDQLNEWFSSYPEKEQDELKSRFKKDFYESFYELFIYQLFRNLNFEIEIHPRLSHTEKRPDFLMKKGEVEFYVEAKVHYGLSTEERALQNMYNQIYDELNRIKLPGFTLAINKFKIKSKTSPSIRPAIKYILDNISGYEHSSLSKLQNGHIINYENDKLSIAVQLIKADNTRTVGLIFEEPVWGGGEEELRKAINGKAKKYGQLPKPYIICINTLDSKTTSRLDVDNAIWGTLDSSLLTRGIENIDESLRKSMSGLFFDDRGIRLKNISGVLVSQISPSNIPSGNYWLYKHPFSKNELDFNQIGLKYCYIEERRIFRNDGTDLDKIFNISKDWLK